RARDERQRPAALRAGRRYADRGDLRVDRAVLRVRAAGTARSGGRARRTGVSPLLGPWSTDLPARPPPLHAVAARGSRASRHRGDRCATSSGLTSAERTSSRAPWPKTARSSWV